MTDPTRSIFRQRAIAKYVQRQERQVMLRQISPPVFGFLWLLLLLLVGAGVFVWSMQVPLFIQSKGIVVQQKAKLKVGQPVRVMIASTTVTFTGVIEHIEAGAMSPAAINAQFHVQIPQTQASSGPYIVATVPVGSATQTQVHPGSICQAQVQTGSANVFSLLPGFSNFPKLFNAISRTSPSA